MFKYLLSSIWKNLLARIAIIVAVTALLVAAIFSNRNQLSLAWNRMFSSPDWDDIARHGGKNYFFEEDPNKAMALLTTAWHELYQIAAHEFPNEAIVASKIITGVIEKKPYEKFIEKRALATIYQFLNAAAQNCGQYETQTAITETTSSMGEVYESHSPQGKIAGKHIYLLKGLLKIESRYIYKALQKKPDFIPAIELSEEIARASCSARSDTMVISRALDYREYVAEKTLFQQDRGKLLETNPELFEEQKKDILKHDAQFRNLLRMLFDETRLRPQGSPSDTRAARRQFAEFPSEKSIQDLVRALYREALHSNPESIRKIHYDLFYLEFPGLAGSSEYQLALIETAYRSGMIQRARNIAANGLKNIQLQDTLTIQKIKRLRLHIDLLEKESEAISRF